MSEVHTRAGVTAVAIGGRAVMIIGPPGSGKSSLALALIDRGASLIGDDGISLELEHGKIVLSPPPNIAGKLEIRGVGIVEFETVRAPLALILSLTEDVSRLPDQCEEVEMLDCSIPLLPFDMRGINQAMRAEWALRTHGISF